MFDSFLGKDHVEVCKSFDKSFKLKSIQSLNQLSKLQDRMKESRFTRFT